MDFARQPLVLTFESSSGLPAQLTVIRVGHITSDN
jgi:hypothetical protein